MTQSELQTKEKKTRPPKVGNWVVTIICKVRKEVACVDCTEQEALDDPWENAIDETEVDQIDWEVVKVVRDE